MFTSKIPWRNQQGEVTGIIGVARDITMQRRDQQEFPALIKITQLALDNGQLHRVLFLSDLTSLHRAEEERLALSQQIIDTQQLALRELSTPLVPIAHEVVAMPLVGSIDDRRAQQIMEALLEGIVAQQASFAIIDVTGVRLIDTRAASALVQIAQAAKLLGAQVVLTGISAEVSQTLIQIGANLGGMVACPNLQAGIAYVTKQMQAYQ
ncbi:MAG: hypothetical protein OHK0050_28520 [Roseiflexaceae bacterium]